MCTITINPASITATPVGTTATHVTVSGTVANCTSNSITVTVSCPAAAPSTGAATISGTTWTAAFNTKCPCGAGVSITATCNDPTPCTAIFNGPLVCNCCPQVATTVNTGLYNNLGQCAVTFVTTLTFPVGCSVTVQRDFGDGNFGAIQTFTSSPATYTETHLYASSAGYTSTLNILSQPSCGGTPAQVTVPPPPPCATSSFLAAFCTLLQFLFLVFGAAAGTLSIALASPVCVALNNALPAVVAGYAAAAILFLLIAFWLCRQCVCAFLIKMLSMLVLIVGALSVMYIALPVCVQPVPYGTPFIALWAALGLILVGMGALLFATWYGINDTICPLTICDYWIAVRDALTYAILSAFLVFGSLAGGVTLSGLGIALLVITLMLINANQQIVVNQNAGNC